MHPFRHIDGDVAYFLGLLIGRGTISNTEHVRQILIEFSYSSLKAQGASSTFDQETAIRLGIENIRERLIELLGTDIRTIRKENSVDLLAMFTRNTMIWRNILLITDGNMSYPYFKIPPILFDPELPTDWKREFVRGYADVAGNIRHSNRYTDGRHRVRLDVLNYRQNWHVPVQLCTLIQEHLEVPIQLITWGHPNMGRDFREHQVNIFAKPFLEIGFSFPHKQQILEEFVKWDDQHVKGQKYIPCPGRRILKQKKDSSPDEYNGDKLDVNLVGNHYDAYWEICKVLGCRREPVADPQMTLEIDSTSDIEA